MALNTHGLVDDTTEHLSWFGDALHPFVVSGGSPTVPASSLTIGAFATKAYIRGSSGELAYVDQAAVAVGPLNAGDGTYWLALHRNNTTTISGWTRQSGTGYLWQFNSVEPSAPANSILLSRVTVAAGVITRIDRLAARRALREAGRHNVLDYGAVGDATTDDTYAFQRLLTLSQTTSMVIEVPGLRYKITSTLTYVRAPGGSLTISGLKTPGLDYIGPALFWYGASGETMLLLKGAVGYLIEKIAFDGRGLAKYGVWIQTNQLAPGGSSSYSGAFSYVGCKAMFGADSAGIQFSDGGSLQISEIWLDHLFMYGDQTGIGSAIRGGEGNAKNYYIRDSVFFYHGTAIRTGNEGPYSITNCVFGHNDIDIFIGNTILNVTGLESEASHYAMTGTGPTAQVNVTNSYWACIGTNPDDYIIDVGTGTYLFDGCQFFNGRTLSSEPRMRVGSISGATILGTSGLTVTRSVFCNTPAGSYPPIYDSANYWVGDRSVFWAGGGPLRLTAQDNMSATGSFSSPVGELLDLTGKIANYLDLMPARSGAHPASILILKSGQPRGGLFQVTIPYTAWTQNAVTAYFGWIFPARTHISLVLAETTQAYAGLAGTIQLRIGETTTSQDFILLHDVKTAPISKGTADADLGVKLARATAVQGGYFGSLTGNNDFIVGIVSGSGAIGNGATTNFTAGSTTITVYAHILQ